MTAKRTKKLKVVAAGGQHFIEVPTLDAAELHTYLRSLDIRFRP